MAKNQIPSAVQTKISDELGKLIYKLDSIELTLRTVHDLLSVQMDMAHALPDDGGVTFTAKSLRGTTVHFVAELENALDALQEVHAEIEVRREETI